MPSAIDELEKDVHEIDKNLAVLVSTQRTTQEQVASLADHVKQIIEVAANQVDLGKKVDALGKEVHRLTVAEARRTGAQGAGAWFVQNLPSFATLGAVLVFLGGK